jgi:predicted DNA binding CopG/RHH family protein
MATLEEYLGGIFHSISSARVLADIQTVDVAEKYARHELLKHFAVPRMRIGDIELTIPIAIEQMTISATREFEPIGNQGLKELLQREIAANFTLKSQPPKLWQDISNMLDVAIVKFATNFETLGKRKAVQEFVTGIATKSMQFVAAQKLATLEVPERNLDGLTRKLNKLVNDNVRGVIDLANPGQIEVIAESHRLREQRPNDLIQIRMKISEEGMEWQTMETSDGSLERKLLPE